MESHNCKYLIYWIRHGETDWNQRGIIQGRRIDAPLNQRGIIQAESFAQYYAEVPFRHVYVSPLKRCIQTVMPLVKKKNLPLTVLEDLIEFDWGLAEGEENEAVWHEYYWGSIHRWQQGEYDYPCPGGESPLQALERMQRAWSFILQQHQHEGGALLICTHSRISRIFFCHLFQCPLREMQRFSIDNVGLYLFRYDGANRIQCLKTNDQTHLTTCALP